ncbi:hypothetical protein GQ53DRAFT_750190 [Thozetella sp. PMI_491]|nr:hypothetical protein GQ53DRAFT_750190 [Thozetella sp. PMI_491]
MPAGSWILLSCGPIVRYGSNLLALSSGLQLWVPSLDSAGPACSPAVVSSHRLQEDSFLPRPCDWGYRNRDISNPP